MSSLKLFWTICALRTLCKQGYSVTRARCRKITNGRPTGFQLMRWFVVGSSTNFQSFPRKAGTLDGVSPTVCMSDDASIGGLVGVMNRRISTLMAAQNRSRCTTCDQRAGFSFLVFCCCVCTSMRRIGPATVLQQTSARGQLPSNHNNKKGYPKARCQTYST